MLKKLLLAVLALVLLVSPLALRWLYFYEGRYEPGPVPRPDVTQLKEPVSTLELFADQVTALSPGTVLVDLAHGNQVQMSELNVLQARLSARGQRLEAVAEADALAGQLRYARALMIVSPTLDWTPDEIQQVEDFLSKGGRLLLVTDPTRFGILYDDWGDYAGLDQDVTHMNDLAARFGLVFQADYLYNTVDNEGNYRNIKLTDFADQPLVEGLNQVVFHATHSIVSKDPPLITAGGETQSSSTERAGDWAVAALVADGAVLALGDLTLMTEPYNAVSDNDRLIANIADFLSGAQRQYELADFPSFFDDEVDLVYAGDPLLNSDLLKGGSSLQSLFTDMDLTLTVRQTEDKARDTLFFGLYDQAEEVTPYLEVAQVTLLITPTGTLDQEQKEVTKPTPTLLPTATPSPAITQPLTITPPVMPALTPEITATAEVTPEAANRVVVESVAEVVMTSTSLLLLENDGERQVLVVLADTEKGLTNAIERLAKGNLTDCLFHEVEGTPPGVLALCPTGEVAEGKAGGGWQEEPVKPPPSEPAAVVTATVAPSPPTGEPAGSILVIALDEGEGRYDSLTGADDYEAILQERYDLTVWSVAVDGQPEAEDLLDYDLVIWTSGDFEDAFGDAESEMFLNLLLEGIPVILSGAYIGDSTQEAVQRDIQVQDATHPLAKGFEAEQVIPFVMAPSGSEYVVQVMEDFQEDTGAIVFVRGPDSESSGAPTIATIEDEFSGMRVVFIGFPIYLLPEESKAQLVLNAVSWLLIP